MKISVITASYNYSDYIPQTIESVLNQTYQYFEYIIFDDGSSDNSMEIIKEYAQKDSRIKICTHENNQNKGLIKTLEEAIKIAKGEYIVFVESDDTISANYLEEKIKIAQNYPQAALIFNRINPIGDENRVIKCKKYLDKVQNIIKNGKFDYYNLLDINIIPTFSCVMVKKSVICEIPFDFILPKCFDWYLWNYIIQKYKIVYTDKALTTFRLHSESLSRKKSNISPFAALLPLSERKYKIQLPYNLFEFYKKQSRIDKLFKPVSRKINKHLYDKLYVKKEVEVINLL